MNFLLHRVYSHPLPTGYRVLVDRVWPRGCRKEALNLDEWARDLAPSTELRNWFGHDPAKWEEFRRRYRRELSTKKEELSRPAKIAQEQRPQPVILLFGAKDEDHNQAVVLRELLQNFRL